jgi:hypothetical protein
MTNEDKQILKDLAYKLLLPTAIISMACLALLMTCKNKPKPKPLPPSILDKKIDSIKIHINKDSLIIDSLMKLKPKIVTRYKTKYDTIYKTAPDTCIYYLEELNHECMVLDSFNNGIITRQETQLISYSELVGIMQERENMQSLRHIEDSLTNAKLSRKLKRTRKLAVAGLFGGLITGAVIK